MALSIQHVTTYRFEEPAQYGLQQLRLTPKSRAGQTVLNWQMMIEGGRAECAFTDEYQNAVSLVSFEPGASEIVIRCQGAVEIEDRAGVVGKHGGHAPLWLFERSTSLTRAGSRVRALARGLKDEHDEDIPRLHALAARIQDAVCL